MHARDHLAARRAACVEIGFRQQRTFGRHRPGVADENRIAIDEIVGHPARQAFGGRDFVFNRFARNQDGRDIIHARARGDRIFAGLQLGALAAQTHAECEQQSVAHRARALELLRNCEQPLARRDQNDGGFRATGRCRSGRDEIDSFEHKRAAKDDSQDQNCGKKSSHREQSTTWLSGCV